MAHRSEAQSRESESVGLWPLEQGQPASRDSSRGILAISALVRIRRPLCPHFQRRAIFASSNDTRKSL
jgi:hypothetical protein